MTRALLITNPAAARADARAVTTVRDTLRGAGWRVEVQATHRAGDACRLAAEARAQGVDVVVCYGGDGTAMEIAAALAGSGLPLGLVPSGTGNLLAGNLRLPLGPARAAKVILRGRPRAVDLGAVERPGGLRYFAVAAGAGFDAQLMRDTAVASKRRWKMGAYVARALASLPRVTSVLHRVTIDGVTHDLSAAMVLIANCGELLPPFLRLRADIVPDDGWLDVVAVRADGAAQSLGAFFELLRGAANGAGRIWFGRGRAARVETLGGGARPVQMDGEPAGETPFEARLVPGALHVLVDPANATHG